MKHLPNELLYLLKIYNYVMYDIGLDHARSRAEDIREYIRKADYLRDHPGLMEYLSEEKSMEDIITYIKRNEKTYELLTQWKDREQTAIFEAKGIADMGDMLGFIGDITVYAGDGCDAYITIPNSTTCSMKIIFKGAALSENITISEEVLWSEFYRTRECYCWELFLDNFETVKLSFEDFFYEKTFYNACNVSLFCSDPWEILFDISEVIFEKRKYDPSLLCEKEKELLPLIDFILSIRDMNTKDASPEAVEAFLSHTRELGLSKAEKLITSQKLHRYLCSAECEGLWRRIYKELCESQEDIPENICQSSAAESERKKAEEQLLSFGYTGKYPDFYKAGVVKGFHTASSYGTDYFVINQKNAHFFIRAIDTHFDDGTAAIGFLSGTVFTKKGENAPEDVFSAMFDDKGKRFFKLTHTFFNDCPTETAAMIAVKRAELKPLTKEERKNTVSVPLSLSLIFGLIFGLLFSVAFFAIAGVLIALILLFAGEIGAFFTVIPWIPLFVFSVLASGISMAIVNRLSHRN